LDGFRQSPCAKLVVTFMILLYGIDDQVSILAMAISNWECLLVIAVCSEHGASSSTS
jgi:hypothetical protein